MNYFKIIIALSFISLSFCGLKWGGCPKLNFDSDTLDINAYLGKWYEIARLKGTPFEQGECVIAQYSLNEDKSIKVDNSQVVDGERQHAIGRAIQTSNPRILEVSFNSSWFSRLMRGNYQIYSTDYDNYSIVYSCTNMYLFHYELVWILSRTPVLEPALLEKTLNLVKNDLDICKDHLKFTDHSKQTCGLHH